MSCEMIDPPKGILGVRHLQTSLMFLALVITFMNRINLSEGIVAMSRSDSDAETVQLTIAEKGALGGAFFWGYALTNVPGSVFAAKMGPIKSLALCMLTTGVITCLLPVVAVNAGFYGIYISRIVLGMAQGPIYACVFTHLAKWAVPKEQGILHSITLAGAQFGTVIMMAISGSLAAISGGWPNIFYASGGCSIVWAVIGLYLGADSPAVHKKISTKERLYIESNFEGSHTESRNLSVPWALIFRSKPVWAIIVAHCSFSWGFWSLLMLTPTYLDAVYKFDLEENGVLSALPYIAMFVVTIVLSPISDKLIDRGVSTATVKKIMNSLAFWVSGGALLALGLLVESAQSSIICLVVASGVLGAIYVGFFGNHVVLSPNFSGVLIGISNGIATIPSIAGPSAAGIFVNDESKQSDWRGLFLVSGLVLIIGNVIFLYWGSGSIQPWNEGKPKKTTPEASQEHFISTP